MSHHVCHRMMSHHWWPPDDSINIELILLARVIYLLVLSKLCIIPPTHLSHLRMSGGIVSVPGYLLPGLFYAHAFIAYVFSDRPLASHSYSHGAWSWCSQNETGVQESDSIQTRIRLDQTGFNWFKHSWYMTPITYYLPQLKSQGSVDPTGSQQLKSPDAHLPSFLSLEWLTMMMSSLSH